MSNKSKIPDFSSIPEKLRQDVRTHAKEYCLKWFDDSFHNQGFTDVSFKAWDIRDPDRRPGGALLVDTAFLRKSLSVLEENQTQITFGTHVPYAGVHNYGLRVRAIQYVRAHHRTRNDKREQVKAHTRKMDTKFPERKFIGESKLMMEGLQNWLFNEIKERFNQK